MQLPPTHGRPSLALAWSADVNAWASDETFGPYALVAPRAHRGGETWHLAAAIGQPPALLLRRVPWGGGDVDAIQRARFRARMAVDDRCLAPILELGVIDGQVYAASEYVFGVDFEAAHAAGLGLPRVAATEVARQLLHALVTLRSASCLPHRPLRARDLRFCLLEDAPAAKLCCNPPLPRDDASAGAAPPKPAYDEQVRHLAQAMLSVTSTADEAEPVALERFWRAIHELADDERRMLVSER